MPAVLHRVVEGRVARVAAWPGIEAPAVVFGPLLDLLPCEKPQEDQLALQKGGPVFVGEHASGCVHLQVLAVGFEPDVAFLEVVVELEGVHSTTSSRSSFLSAA